MIEVIITIKAIKTLDINPVVLSGKQVYLQEPFLLGVKVARLRANRHAEAGNIATQYFYQKIRPCLNFTFN